MSLQFRPTSPADEPAVAAFLREIFAIDASLPLTASRHLHWKNWEERPDWPGSRGYILTKDDAIVAHGTVVPLSYVYGEQQARMVHVIDWAADPKSVGSGVILMRNIFRLTDAVLAIGGSDMTQKVLPSLGFRAYGAVTSFVRPLRPLRRLTEGALSLRSGAQVARSLLWSLQAPSVPVQGWTANRIAPDLVAAQSIPWPRGGEETALFARTAAQMTALLRCPVTPMELYTVAKGAENRGYFLLAHAPGQTRIADFYIDSKDPADWRILIQLAVSRAEQNPAAVELASMGSEPVTRQALLDCGFHPRGEAAIRILHGKQMTFPAGSLRFQMIDNDFAYLHQNRNEYWA